MRLDKSHKIFFELLKAGLWGGLRPVQEFKSSRLCGLGKSVQTGTGTVPPGDCTQLKA